MTVVRTTGLRRGLLALSVLAVATTAAGGGVCRAQARTAPARPSADRPASADVVDEGIAALERGDVIAARALFEKALSLNPKDVAAHTNLGILADRAGDLEDAARHFAAAARLGPSASTHNNYGVILLRLGHTRDAAAELEKSLRADPRQPSALVNLAQIRFATGAPEDLRAAADLLARAYAMAPDVEIARASTVVALARKDKATAAAHYAEYAAEVAKASGAAADAAARAELGSALREAGLLTEAEAELTAAVALAPASGDIAVQLARVYIAREELPAAGRTLEAAVARGIDEAPVYALLAEVYERSGHIENAIPAMRLAIQRDPQSEKYRFGYGLLLMNAYAPAAAAIRLEEALKVFPDSPRLWFALGLAHFKNDREAESEQALKRALELDPKFAPAAVYLGMVRAKAGQKDEAVAIYEDALRIDPKLGVVHYLIAESLITKPEIDAPRIEAHLRRVVEMDPTFVPARLSLARLLARADRWTEAVAELERAVAINPNLAETYYQLGRAYARVKRAEDARKALATFERLNTTQKQRDNDELYDVLRRLADVRF